MSVIAPVQALSILSVHLSDKCQEILGEIAGTSYGRKPHLK